MLTGICILIGSGIGALVGAAVSTTKKGKEMNESLKDTLDLYENKLSKYIPKGNIIKKLEEKL